MDNNLIRDNYQPESRIFEIVRPEIETGHVFYFTADSGLKYEVRFGQKKDNQLGYVVNFGIIDDEYEDEYSETNKGEVYRIIATVIEIIRIFHSQHIYTDTYEFTGEYKKGNEHLESSVRTRLYYRTALRILSSNWIAELEGNKVVLKKKRG